MNQPPTSAVTKKAEERLNLGWYGPNYFEHCNKEAGLFLCAMTLFGHRGWVHGVDMTPDNRLVVSSADDKRVILWHGSTGAIAATLSGHSAAVLCVCLSSDGSLALSGSMDGTVKLWEVSSCVEMVTLVVGSAVSCVRFNSDDSNVLVAAADSTVRIFDTSTSRELLCLRGHTLAVRDAVYSPTEEYVLSSGSDARVLMWKLDEPGAPYAELQGHTGDVRCLVWCALTGRLATGSDDCSIRVWNAENLECEVLCRGHRAPVTSLSLSASGLYLVSSSMDKTVQLWEFSSGRPLYRFDGHTGPVFRVKLSIDE